jgi:hypothetical protein
MAGVALVAGLVLSAGPLLGAMVSVVRVLHVFGEAGRRGETLPVGAVRFPYEPIALGFAAFLPGILLLSLSVLSYSRRVKLRRESARAPAEDGPAT